MLRKQETKELTMKNLTPIKIRAFYHLSIDELLTLNRDIPIVFEDNVIINAKAREVVVFVMLTKFILKWNVNITSDIWIANFYKNGYFASSTYLNMYSLIYKKIIKEYLEPTGQMDQYPNILEDIYTTVNEFINDFVFRIQDYNIDIEITDIIPIAFDKRILESLARVKEQPSQQAIEDTYKTLDTVIMSDEHKSSVMELVYSSGMVNINQLRQLFGSRGYLTEINSKIFKIPMVNSFTMGFANMYEALIESRAGAKALYLSTNAIRQSERRAREFQLAIMPVEEIVYGDCGNRDYMEFYVRPKDAEYKGDLRNLIGSKYLNENGEWETITPEHTHLEGKTIKLRSVLHCKLRNKKQVCSACYGELTYGLFKHSNLGHINVTYITQRISQSLLSTKHLLKSANATEIAVDPKTAEYFVLKDQDKLFIKPTLLGRKTRRLYIYIPQNQAFGLRSIENLNLLNVNLAKVSRIRFLELVVKDKNGIILERTPVKIAVGKRAGHLTLKFLNYIKNGHLDVDEDYYVVDVTELNKKIPIIKYEQAEFDFNALSDEFASLITSRKYISDGKRIRSEYTAEVLVQKAFDLLNKKLDINIKKIEMLVYGFTAYDLNNNNFDLARNSKYLDVAKLSHVITHRSIGGSYGWTKQHKQVLTPFMFIRENKPDHPLDVLFKPNEVINYYKNIYPKIKDKR